jgi:hypothetical protein
MELQQAVRAVFGQLTASLCQLQPTEYSQGSPVLSGHTIGQHVRHIIELFQALENGYATGLVNYEKRKRDPLIETDPVLASGLLRQIGDNLDRPDRPLILEAGYTAPLPDGQSPAAPVLIATNYYREIAYNLEHTIHHMAMIRIGIGQLASPKVLPEGYGIASSTLKYRRECAQ